MDFRNSTFKIDQRILFYSNAIIFPIGILVNVIQIFFFSQKKFINKTIGHFFVVISISNILAISMTIIRFFRLNDIYDLFSRVNLWCKILPFLTRLTFQGCSWLNFFYTFDRVYFIFNPTVYNNCNHKNLIVWALFLLIYLILVVVNLPNLFYRNLEISHMNATKLVCSASPPVNIIRELLSQVVGIFIPFFLMLTVNLCLVWKVLESRRKFKGLKELNFSFPLIISNIFYLIFQLPFSVYLIYLIVLAVNPKIYFVKNFKTQLLHLDAISRIIVSINYSFYLCFQAFLNKTIQKEMKRLSNKIVLKCFVNRSKIFSFSKTTSNKN